jgi:hypothetical protein
MLTHGGSVDTEPPCVSMRVDVLRLTVPSVSLK